MKSELYHLHCKPLTFNPCITDFILSFSSQLYFVYRLCCKRSYISRLGIRCVIVQYHAVSRTHAARAPAKITECVRVGYFSHAQIEVEKRELQRKSRRICDYKHRAH